MTVVVAFCCTDGAVVAADSMLTASVGHINTGHHHGKKVHVLAGNQIFAYAGDIGQAERFRHLAEGGAGIIGSLPNALEYPLRLTKTAIEQFQQTGVGDQVGVNTILAFPYAGVARCCAFMGKVQPWLLDANHFYVALGSGKQMADPFLRFLVDIFCPHQPTVREAIFLATWTIEHVIQTNPGGVAGPIKMATLETSTGSLSAREFTRDEIGEQQQAVQSAAQALRDWRDIIGGRKEATSVGEPPSRPRDRPSVSGGS